MVFADHPRHLQFVSLIHLSSCQFYNNSEGRNMINYIVVGDQSELVIENCTFVNNSNNDIAMLELNMKAIGSLVSIKHSDFTNNLENAIVYFQIHSRHIVSSLFNISMINNVGFAIKTEEVLIEVSDITTH